MTHRVDRSLASFPRRTFLKTAAVAGLSPLAFAQANQDKNKPKHGRIFVLVVERDLYPKPPDPTMTGFFAIDPDSGVWERVATSKECAVKPSISPQDDAVVASRFGPEEAGIWMFEPMRDKEPRRIIDKKPAAFFPSLLVDRRAAVARELLDQGTREGRRVRDVHISSRRDRTRKDSSRRNRRRGRVVSGQSFSLGRAG